MNTIKVFFLIMFLAAFAPAFSGDIDYAVNKIPAALLKNANVVKRYQEMRFEVINTGRAKLYHKVAITVLNEKGDRYVRYRQDYDKLHSIESIEGRLFDEYGKKIRTLKKSEIQDLSGTSEISLADDNRIKQFSFYHKLYPYTVEYETEIKYNYTLFYPSWVPQEDEYYSVEHSSISVICPPGINFRYKAFNYPGQPVVSKEKNNTVSTWTINNVVAIEDEYASPHWFEMTPVVCMAPVQFQVEEYKGDMSSWQDFGKFVFALKDGRDELPQNIKNVVHNITDGIPDARKKIEVLYDFLQKNTRYISIQLGIGGWQPFDAKYVAANGYGDCKALTNYMYALLKEAGIKSYYTLVKSGENNHFFISDFPSSQFNHVILCVPVQKDTVWLECTSQTLNAGYLSGFTSDRNVLLIDESGGKLVRTPRYTAEQNLQSRKINAVLDIEGNLSADIFTSYKAYQQDDLHQLINGLSKEKVMEYLKDEIDLPTYNILKFDYKEEKNRLPVIRETLIITANHYAQVTGSRLFIIPNLLTRSPGKLIMNDERMFDVVLTYEYKEVDTIEIKIPPGYQPEAVPKPVKIDNKFGQYDISIRVEGDKILCYRTMQRFKGRFPVTAYNELVKFYEQIYKSDRSKVVLVKK